MGNRVSGKGGVRTAYGTPCCKRKRRTPLPVPAVDRYLSRRIRSVWERSRRDGALFFILSGKYGPLLPEKEIPWYDHLLREEEAAAMKRKTARFLVRHGVGRLVFFSSTEERDPQLRPYLRAVREACRETGTVFRHVPTASTGRDADGRP